MGEGPREERGGITRSGRCLRNKKRKKKKKKKKKRKWVGEGGNDRKTLFWEKKYKVNI